MPIDFRRLNKITLGARLPAPLIKAMRAKALEEDVDDNVVVAKALCAYLDIPLAKYGLSTREPKQFANAT